VRHPHLHAHARTHSHIAVLPVRSDLAPQNKQSNFFSKQSWVVFSCKFILFESVILCKYRPILKWMITNRNQRCQYRGFGSHLFSTPSPSPFYYFCTVCRAASDNTCRYALKQGTIVVSVRQSRACCRLVGFVLLGLPASCSAHLVSTVRSYYLE
jgi:hypothetical protein